MRILLCSDGLSSYLDESVIADAMVSADFPARAADLLVETALCQGVLDNVTVLVVGVHERHASAQQS